MKNVCCVCARVSSTLCHAGHISTPLQDTTLFSAYSPTGYSAAIRNLSVSFCKRFWKVVTWSLQSGNEMVLFRSMECLAVSRYDGHGAFVDGSER